MKLENIKMMLWQYFDVIISSDSMDEYEVTPEDIHNIAESIEDDILWDSLEHIQDYIEQYIEKNQWFDVTSN